MTDTREHYPFRGMMPGNAPSSMDLYSCTIIIIIMVQQIIDRAFELRSLREQRAKNEAGLAIVYGRRRVGKTFLLSRFLEEAPGIYFLAGRRDLSGNLREFQRLSGEYLGDELFGKIEFGSWSEMFGELCRRLLGKKAVIVIDELPYMAGQGVMEDLQKAWDLHLSKSKILLALSGSSIGMMERLTMDYGAPLYGRRTMQLRVERMPAWHAREFFPGWSLKESIEAFSVLDGIPFYLQQFDDGLTLLENLEKNYLRKDRVLYEEAEVLLRSEVREFGSYFSVLRAISDGHRGFGDIAVATGRDKPSLSKYLSNLLELRVVCEDQPFGADRQRLRRYRLADNYYTFWFRFVLPNRHLVESEHTGPLLDIIKRDMPMHVSRVFEQVVRETVVHFLGYPVCQAWWNRVGDEIDVVAADGARKTVLLGEVKWGDAGYKDYQALKEKGRLPGLPAGHDVKYILVCGGKIKDRPELEREGVLAMDMRDLERIFKAGAGKKTKERGKPDRMS